MVTRRKTLTKDDLDAGLEQLDGRISSLDGRLSSLDGRLSSLDGRISSLDKDFERRLGVAVEQIRADIKAFGAREHSKDIAALKKP